MKKFFKNNYHILTYVLLYSSIIIAFYFDENVTGGAKNDFQYILKQIDILNENFLYSFLNYDEIEHHNRLSPVYITLLLIFKKIFISLEFARIVLIHILILSQFYFYKCLKIIYQKKFSLDKKILFFLSCVIFISPSFRSNIIWVESSMIGILLFLIGHYYFIKNLKEFKSKNIYLNIFFIAAAAYIRPTYCLFAIYYFYFCFTYYRDKISIYNVILLNIILAFPAFYYLFILDVFFIGHISSEYPENHLNYFNKIAIIGSIIIFHSIPFLFYKNFFLDEFTKKKFFTILSIIISSILIFNFNYNLNNTGGGIFLHISDFFTNSNYLFYLLLPFFTFFILNILKINLRDNLVVFLILFLITPQYHIFHKYYDPLVFILFLTMINFNLGKNFFIKKRFITSAYLLFFSHYVISFINTYYINY
jgi:hypothetical protein